jgi:hypothetical protein
MPLEMCSECGEPTTRAGAGEDSIHIEMDDGIGRGPLCEPCWRKIWYCETCDLGVSPFNVTFDHTHDKRRGGCGGPVT